MAIIYITAFRFHHPQAIKINKYVDQIGQKKIALEKIKGRLVTKNEMFTFIHRQFITNIIIKLVYNKIIKTKKITISKNKTELLLKQLKMEMLRKKMEKLPHTH